uniref:Endonuclease/exonuclease/phosphatase domain-containing protein n=1 Tax=Angiostrongylus cantonensis TaxID=6313 RepID=A0A0K0DQ59_ANGCA
MTPDPERANNFAALGTTSTVRLLKSQGQWKLPGSRTMVTICTYNARTLASESSIEDLLMQARKIRNDVIGLAETRRRHLFNAVYDTGEEMFPGTCDSRGVGGVGVLVNTSLSVNIDAFEQLTTRIGHLRLKRCGSTPALTIFVFYAPTSNYDEELEAFYMDLERFYKEDHRPKTSWSSLEIICLDRTKKVV